MNLTKKKFLTKPAEIGFSVGSPLNSQLEGIHPVVLANTLHCKGDLSGVLYRFKKELLELEQGVETVFEGHNVELRATLVAVKADTKAAHEVLGFLAPGARHFCRLCMLSRFNLHAGDTTCSERVHLCPKLFYC